MVDHYLHRIGALIEEAERSNDKTLDQAAAKFAESLAGGGLIHLFGSGHSVLPCQEAFPRYGSFVGFNPLTDPRLMWHNVLGPGGVRELLWLERTENYITKFLDHQPLNAGDGILVYSHSGRNAAGIETALYAKKRDLFVVAVTSRNLAQNPKDQQQGNKRESDQNHADAIQQIPSSPLQLPVWRQGVNLPFSYAVVNGYRPQDAKDDDDSPQGNRDQEQDGLTRGPSPSRPQQCQMGDKSCPHPDRHDSTKKTGQHLNGRQEFQVIGA
jgi:uncharacterized phosphosugar-binding protein